MIRMLALLLLMAALTVSARAEADPELRRFVFFAVLEGLYELNLPDQAVDRLLEVDAQTGRPISFIYNCPICTPAYDAFRAYRQRPRDLEVAGQAPPAELLAELTQDRPLGRTAALARLVQQLLSRRIAAARWTEEERRTWRARFERAAEEGQRQLRLQQKDVEAYKPMWSCMLCDAASRACKTP